MRPILFPTMILNVSSIWKPLKRLKVLPAPLVSKAVCAWKFTHTGSICFKINFPVLERRIINYRTRWGFGVASKQSHKAPEGQRLVGGEMSHHSYIDIDGFQVWGLLTGVVCRYL